MEQNAETDRKSIKIESITENAAEIVNKDMYWKCNLLHHTVEIKEENKVYDSNIDNEKG